MELFLGMLAYTFEIYFDFSGYSDMAVGVSQMLNIDLPINFNSPYRALSVRDFWKRWHISLTSFLTRHLYIPLGGSRMGLARTCVNMMIVFLVSGIWHGANWTFLIWGLWYFVLLAAERFLLRPEARPLVFRLLWRVATLVFVICGWVMFNSADVSSGLNFLRGLFGFYKSYNGGMEPFFMSLHLREYGVFVALALVFTTPVMEKLEALMERHRITAYVKAVATPLITGMMFIWAVSYLLLGQHNPFIYYNF